MDSIGPMPPQRTQTHTMGGIVPGQLPQALVECSSWLFRRLRGCLLWQRLSVCLYNDMLTYINVYV